MKKLFPWLLSFCCGMPFFGAGQPIRTVLLPAPGSLRITNDSLPKNFTNITLDWQLFVNGVARQKGTLPGLQLLPGRSRTVRLPLNTPAPGEEAIIKVEYRGPTRSRPILAGQDLPWKPWGGDLRVPAAGELNFADSGNIFTISSPGLRLSFDKETGWISQYEANHYLLLADTNGLRPAFSAQPHLQLFSTSTGSQMVIVRTEYTVPELSCLLHLSYTVNAAGILLIEQTLETDTTRGDSLLPSIDRFGMNWAFPPGADSVTWYAPASINPDRGPAINNAQHSGIKAGKVRWLSIRDHDGKGFRLTADSNLLFLMSMSTPTAAAISNPPTTPMTNPPTSPILNPHAAGSIYIDGDPLLPKTLPVHYHFAFKVTPLTSYRDR